MRSTGAILKRQLWIWPILAMVVLAIIGSLINSAIRSSIESSVRSEITTLLHIERSMLEKWFHLQEANAISIANDSDIRKLIAQFIAERAERASSIEEATSKPETLSMEKMSLALKQLLQPGMSAHDFVGFVVADRDQRIIAAQTQELIGQVVPQFRDFVGKVIEGKSTVSVPFPSMVLMRDRTGNLRADVPTMFVCAPILDENLQPIAAIGLRIRPEKEFTEMLHLGQFGKTGETYAIDKNGLMVSNSRFDDDLALLGLIPDKENASSILYLQVRDPGGSLQQGFRSGVRRAELPLTFACSSAIAGETGVSIVGHRNYRGEAAVSAWTWLPNYDLGLITEIDLAEAFRPLTILRWSFFTLFGLLVATSIAIFIFTLVIAKVQREAREAAIEAKELGQYRLERMLGTGAMGVVYKGHHSMMRRPTAIKLLKSENVSPAAIERFEHEVQITCQLNNPHTIAIYDYGRTPEGVFYYAMEYLDGIDLQSLVERYGPQPEGRVISILIQVCSSLFEAHSLGLVHRDIKPANIMLNRRGGECDVIKVLDFGLVRSLEGSATVQGTTGITGTPMYMSPEAIKSPAAIDVRSDLYSVGAVGYFLLTGKTIFQAENLSELFQKHLDSTPEPPSTVLNREIDTGLENAILACLDKNRAHRPQTARDLSILLESAVPQNPWTKEDAQAWWRQFDRESRSSNSSDNSESNLSNKDTQAPNTQNQSTNAKIANAKKSTVASSFDMTIAHSDSESAFKPDPSER
jgi:serine/threonine protein kinase